MAKRCLRATVWHSPTKTKYPFSPEQKAPKCSSSNSDKRNWIDGKKDAGLSSGTAPAAPAISSVSAPKARLRGIIPGWLIIRKLRKVDKFRQLNQSDSGSKMVEALRKSGVKTP